MLCFRKLKQKALYLSCMFKLLLSENNVARRPNVLITRTYNVKSFILFLHFSHFVRFLVQNTFGSHCQYNANMRRHFKFDYNLMLNTSISGKNDEIASMPVQITKGTKQWIELKIYRSLISRKKKQTNIEID